jgi:alkanesulfonate monooxygenase SsuD/methylene tetrahydromethanopterin reductase-like flavin-dependent oxidoreductase (luciferase family)
VVTTSAAATLQAETDGRAVLGLGPATTSDGRVAGAEHARRGFHEI